ncbi:hypothetical protein AYO49_00785 [Verrucomicrobiaceae bacterium SCGC AG-212-N21]|nr:hypothetical protein AYO49_00785 [Verrucomicrobiaceae bacterium SCGC AG-212-N21]
MPFLSHPLRLAMLLIATCGYAVAAAGFNAADATSQIDSLLTQHWSQNKVTPNPVATDETIVRRVYLDIVGRIPTLQETREFLDSKEPDKRAKLIDHLLASDGHAQHMFHFWADILRVQSRANGGQGEMTSKPYLEHVKKRLRENQPYDQFVRELLTAQGKIWQNPAIGYYMRDLGMPLDNLANTTRIFLGTRIECAQCHNHPFDKWTQMQFYQMAAFTYPLETNFTGIAAQDEVAKMKRAADKDQKLATQTRWLGAIAENLGDFVRYSKVQALPSRKLKLPHDYQYADAKPHDFISPVTMLGKKVACDPKEDTVGAFADWMTSPENPRFTTVIANRMWKKVFGLGLIEPVDEFMDSTVAAQPELMNALEQMMIACRYDLREFLRVLYNTDAYQRDVTRAELMGGEIYHFTGPLLRRMTAEQIWDSFVTLIHVTPDLPRRHGIDTEMAGKLVYKGKLSDALDLLSAQEIFDGSMKAALAYEAGAERSKVLKDEFAAAQKAKNKPLMEKLNLDIRSLNFVARTGIHDHVVVPAVARLYTQKTGQPAPPPIPVRTPSLDEMKKAGQQREYIDVPGYDVDRAIPREEEAAAQARDAVFRAEAERLTIPEAEQQRYLAARRSQAREWMRAADLESPAPRGHYLRDFGQSDRDMIENANPDATMGQALVLMNSTLFEQIIQPYTQLRLNLAAARYPEEQLDVVYQTLFSRRPTPGEVAAWDVARKSGLDSTEDLIYALINTQQFIFVQ